MVARVKVCATCGCEFTDRTRSGIRKRCDDCQQKHNKERDRQRGQARTASGHWSLDTLKRKYGWTPEDFDAQFSRQRGGCAVCGSTEPKGHGRWHIDHDHESGRVRGILCHNCNLAVGNARDDPALLRAMAAYLRRHGKG